MDMNQIETEAASKEEEAQYEQALEMALRAINEGQTAKNIVKRVDNQGPVDGLAESIFVIVRRVEVQLGQLMDAVKIQLAEDVFYEIADLMLESGRIDEKQLNEQMVEQVVAKAYQMYVEDAEQNGTLDTQGIQEDVAASGVPMPQKQQQGMNAMSNPEAEKRGLMNV